MKLRNNVFVSLVIILLPISIFAQSSDTVYAPAEKESGKHYVNSLVDFVGADTNSEGETSTGSLIITTAAEDFVQTKKMVFLQ